MFLTWGKSRHDVEANVLLSKWPRLEKGNTSNTQATRQAPPQAPLTIVDAPNTACVLRPRGGAQAHPPSVTAHL